MKLTVTEAEVLVHYYFFPTTDMKDCPHIRDAIGALRLKNLITLADRSCNATFCLTAKGVLHTEKFIEPED